MIRLLANTAEILIITIIGVGVYILAYLGPITVCLMDDLEFQYGKAAVKSRCKQSGFWRKFVFLDCKDKVVSWHYALFWVNLVSFIPALVSLDVSLFSECRWAETAFYVFGIIWLLSLGAISCVRRGLYKGNIVRARNRRKYRH